MKYIEWLFSSRDQRDFEIIIRVMVGFIMFYHGVDKIQNPLGLVPYLEAKNIPFPELGSFLASVTEFFGGLALMLGFMTRVAAFALMFNMAVAIHSLDGWFQNFDITKGGQEYQYLLFVCYLYYALAGAGYYSLDNKWNKLINQSEH